MLTNIFRIDDAPNQVYKYSLFWATIALATNTMSQPAGRVCDAPSEIRIPLRSSPIICAIDTFYVLKLLLFDGVYKKNGRTCKEIYHNLLAHRFRSYPISGRPCFDNSYLELRQHTLWRWALFVVATSQAVKLYALEGSKLLWVKIIGSTYISSFLAMELLAWLLRKEELEEKVDCLEFQEVSGAATLPYISYTISAVFDFYLLAQIFPYLFTGSELNNLHCTSWVLVAAGFPIAFLCLFYSITCHDPLGQGSKMSWTLTKTLSFILLLLMIAMPSFAIWAFPAWKSNSSPNCFTLFLILLWAITGSIWGERTFSQQVKLIQGPPPLKLPQTTQDSTDLELITRAQTATPPQTTQDSIDRELITRPRTATLPQITQDSTGLQLISRP
jgi:hypothetical protein